MKTVGMGVKPKNSKRDNELSKTNKELTAKVAELSKTNKELTAKVAELEAAKK